jgi:hypothetical protein
LTGIVWSLSDRAMGHLYRVLPLVAPTSLATAVIIV